ncbi:MAG: hypothetical protein HOW73_39850 [Polyangiaceae bacterium]|nr:hypothetical protein [Polyangiaceae bacterium]
MPSAQRFAMYGGLGLVSLGSVSLSVVLTRLYSAALGHHLAFLAVSLALFGVGLGGGIVVVAPRLLRTPYLFRRMSLFAALASVTSIITIIKTLVTKVPETLDKNALVSIGVLYALSTLPFTFIGMIVAAALKHARGRAARLYFADMVGAAAGGACALLLLRLGAPRAGLVVAILLAVAGVMFAIGSLEKRGPFSDGEVRGAGWSSSAILCSTLALFAGDYGEQWLTVRQLRFVNLDRAQVVRWNELALVTVDRPVGGMAWLRMDASAASAILSAKTQVPKHPAEMGYTLSGAEGPTLVIGAGGGREVRAALAAGQTEVVAVEINRAIAREVMLGKLFDYSGGLYAKPEVKLVVADGRSFVRSDDRLYRNIVLSLVDTWAASSVGGLALSEDGLYTVESFRELYDHLAPEGVLVVNRWDPEIDRLLALASAALRSRDVADPRAHLFACSYAGSTALLVAKTALSADAIEKLRDNCEKQGFVEVFAPDQEAGDVRARIVADPWNTNGLVRGRDISPPTDERPFFFYTVPPREVFATIRDRARLAKEQHGLLTALVVLAVSAIASLLFLVLPALVRPSELVLASARFSRVRALAFFACIGVGFAVVEIGLTQMLTMFLGHPVYALSAVLASLLLAVGIGSLLVRRVPMGTANLVAARRAQILTVLLVACALGLLPLTSALVGLPFPARVVIAIVVCGVLGILMGALAPLGISIASTRGGTLVAWGWALNGFFGVTATALAVLIAMNLGYSFVLLLGAAAYFIASAVVPPAAPPQRSSRPSVPSTPEP